ncbi:DUF2868 domain-containing protein [Achromobacter xylosoxidans]|uniref:DUF2868 domain-containing protein n=1 Tax=Alcaligenes xylosoxydans xylosoxydans TaxID=85698 RepID=UPI003BF47E67
MHQPRVAAPLPAALGGQPVLMGLELPADLHWPPAVPAASIRQAGNLDTREQRNHLLDALSQAAASRLLIACDARQTPDRGTLALIAELAAHAGQTRVWLLAPAAADTREALWRERLAALGLAAGAVFGPGAAALAWLEQGHD